MLLVVLIVAQFLAIWSRTLSKSNDNCWQSFAKSIDQGLPSNTLKSVFLDHSKPSKDFMSLQSRKLIIDATLELKYALFHRMTQLNISGIDQSGNSTLNCRVENRTLDTDHLSPNKYFYVNAGLHWLHMIDANPQALVVMNDFPCQEWFDQLHQKFKSIHNTDQTSITLFGNMTLAALKSLQSAHHELVKCAVPSKQLLVVESTLPSADFWSRLTKFLDISLPSVVMKQLVDGGVEAPLKLNEVCRAGGSKALCGRQFWDVPPNVCEDRSDWQPENERVLARKCAVEYAQSMENIFALPGLKSLFLNRLMESSTTIRRASRGLDRLIINAAPGTTGTRTLHLAMMQLNITSRHFNVLTMNCGQKTHRESGYQFDIDSDMRIFLNEEREGSVGSVVYWGDTPASERWWHLLQMYPKTRILVTDVTNVTSWVGKRLNDHCNHGKSRLDQAWSPCTIPVPVSFERWTPLSVQFHRVSHVSQINSSKAERAFEAYRQLIRCVVPKQQQMWMFVSEQRNATQFWKQLIDFFRLDISSADRNRFYNESMPRFSNKGCIVNGQPCKFNAYGSLVPSVCAHV